MAVHDVDITGLQLTAPHWGDDRDPVWITVRPNLRRVHVLAGDILQALRKDRNVAGKGRNESEDVRLASAWLAGHHTTDLVVVDAQRLHPRILYSVVKLAAAGGVNLWLLHRPPRTDEFDRTLHRHGSRGTTLHKVPTPTQPRATPELAGDQPSVPAHDFHVFAAAVTANLPEPEATRVLDMLHQATMATMRALDDATDPKAQLAHDVTLLIVDAPPTNELITRLRGIQVAAWHHDLHVSVDLDTLANSLERPRISPADAAAALLSYHQPYRAITWLLAAHHIGLDEIATLPLAATDASGATIRTSAGCLRVPEPLQAAIRSQRLLRTNAGAHQNEPLLPHNTKTLSYALTDATNDLGLPAHGRLAERRAAEPAAWLRKLGITIRALP